MNIRNIQPAAKHKNTLPPYNGFSYKSIKYINLIKKLNIKQVKSKILSKMYQKVFHHHFL